jgi:four helix bundle suffix protein
LHIIDFFKRFLVFLRSNRKSGHRPARTGTDKKEQAVKVSDSQCQSVFDSTLVANATLSLLNLCCCFLDRQLSVQAASFEKEGGFTERLYRTRT